ncbi:MAG: hypothetical protein ACYDGR_16545 [Candidatus Dormibacteria bacterium]
MEIGFVQLELQRTGDTAKLLLRAKPFSHETPITLTELEHLALYLADQVGRWRDARIEAEGARPQAGQTASGSVTV